MPKQFEVRIQQNYNFIPHKSYSYKKIPYTVVMSTTVQK